MPRGSRKPDFSIPDSSERKEALGRPSNSTIDYCVQDADSYWEPMRALRPGDWLEEHHESGQTVNEFRTCGRNRVDKKRSVIYILPFSGDMNPDFLSYLKQYCSSFFKGLTVKILPPKAASKIGVASRSNPYDGQFQYNAGDMLKKLMTMIPQDAYCMIGISKEDIYPRDSWNFCFGLASVSNRVGVFSFARYDPSFCDGDSEEEDDDSTCSETELSAAVSNKAMLHYRSCRVMAHEICHMFGIKHCIYYNCMMNGSNSSSESCRKPPYLCPVCLKKLHLAIGFDPIERYSELASIMKGQPVWKKARDFYSERARVASGLVEKYGPRKAAADAPTKKIRSKPTEKKAFRF